MKLTALATVILALGIALGLALHGGLDGPAMAAPKCPPKCPTPTATPTPTPPPQQREDQVDILSGALGAAPSEDPDWVFRGPAISFDPDDYPPGATFRFEGVFQQPDDDCARLAVVTDPTSSPLRGSPIAESEVCGSPSLGFDNRDRSGPLTLQSGKRVYMTQVLASNDGFGIEYARIIVQWTQ
jgi:hypothetical protein